MYSVISLVRVLSDRLLSKYSQVVRLGQVTGHTGVFHPHASTIGIMVSVLEHGYLVKSVFGNLSRLEPVE